MQYLNHMDYNIFSSAFDCIDCGINTKEIHEYYMVKNNIWLSLKLNRSGMLCIGCLERRLGRRLTSDDFNLELPINKIDNANSSWNTKKSNRLLNRLGYV